MSLENVATWLGAGVMVAGGIGVTAGLLTGAAYLSNYASRIVLESYGGWKVFLEYRDWYQKRRSAPTTEGAEHE